MKKILRLNLLYKLILVHRSFLHFSHQCIPLFKLGFSTKMLNNKKWLQNCKQISRRYIDLTKKCLQKNLEWKCTFFLLFTSALCHMKSGPPERLGMWGKGQIRWIRGALSSRVLIMSKKGTFYCTICLEFWKLNKIAKPKGQLISGCLFGVFNFPNKQCKNLMNFCPTIQKVV